MSFSRLASYYDSGPMNSPIKDIFAMQVIYDWHNIMLDGVTGMNDAVALVLVFYDIILATADKYWTQQRHDVDDTIHKILISSL